MDVGDDVLAVDDEFGVLRQAQGGVEDGAVLGGVDVFAGEHRLTTVGDLRLIGQLEQRGEELVVEEVLGQVDVQVGCVEGEALGALGIRGEGTLEVGRVAVVERGEFGPGGRGRGIYRSSHALSLVARTPTEERPPRTFHRGQRTVMCTWS